MASQLAARSPAAFKLLTSMMRNPVPVGSALCPAILGIAATVIDRAINACDTLSAKIKLAKSHPEFLRAGIKFLTFNQSFQDFTTTINHLVQCHCNFCQTSTDRLDSGTRLVFGAVTTVIQCIILTLSGLSQHKFRTGNPIGDEQPWPQGPKDLLPFGPKDSVAGLDLWVERPPNGSVIFSLAGRLATFYAPFATEIFNNFTFALGRPCQHLKSIIAFHRKGDSSPLARKRFFTSPINHILNFFSTLLQVDPVRYRGMIVVRGDWLKPILPPLTTILSNQPSEPLWIKARTQVSFLSSYANAKLDPITGVPSVKFDFHQFAEAAETIDPLEEAFHMLRDARKLSLGCWNLHCPLQSEAIHLRLCSRCNLVRFCGKKCQKDAWTFAPMPHKAVCAQIYSLKEALGAEWSLMLTPGFTYPQFRALLREKNIDTAVVKAIADARSAVWLGRSAFLEDFKNACFTGF